MSHRSGTSWLDEYSTWQGEVPLGSFHPMKVIALLSRPGNLLRLNEISAFCFMGELPALSAAKKVILDQGSGGSPAPRRASSGSRVVTRASGTKTSVRGVEESMPTLAVFFGHRGCHSALRQIEKIQTVIVRVRFLIIRRQPHALRAISPATHRRLTDFGIEAGGPAWVLALRPRAESHGGDHSEGDVGGSPHGI